MSTPRVLPHQQFKELWVLVIASGVDMVGFAMVLPLMPFYALRLNATPEP